MISKNNITSPVKTLKQLISSCESYGELDKEGNLHLPIVKTEHIFVSVSKEKLMEYESSEMTMVEVNQKLEEQGSECKWADASLEIQMPKPKLRTKIF